MTIRGFAIFCVVVGIVGLTAIFSIERFKQTCEISGLPQSKSENGNKYRRYGDDGISIVVQKDESAIGFNATRLDEKAQQFGRTFFGFLGGLLAALVGYTFLKRR